MDSKLWNLISAAVLLIGFAIQWGTFANRVSNLETTTGEMKRTIQKNDGALDAIKEDTAEIKTLIQSHISAHRGLPHD